MTPRPRSDEKAHRILQAARVCLGERGFAATTVSQVAAEAGVSRGLLHYYFASKEELLVKVVRSNLKGALDLLGDLLQETDSPADLAARLTAALRLVVTEDPAFFCVVFEGWVVGRQSTAVGREVAVQFELFRRALEARLGEAARRGAITSGVPIRVLALALSSLLDGLALQLVADQALASEEATWSGIESAMRALVGKPA